MIIACHSCVTSNTIREYALVSIIEQSKGNDFYFIICVILLFFVLFFFFFFQAEDGIRDGTVTGVQTCALPIYNFSRGPTNKAVQIFSFADFERQFGGLYINSEASYGIQQFFLNGGSEAYVVKIGRASCRERV